MDQITIRVAGPYTVTTDGSGIFVNGRRATAGLSRPGSNVAWLVRTGERGANGAEHVVGLTKEQWAIYTTAAAVWQAAINAAPETLPVQRPTLVSNLRFAREADYEAREAAFNRTLKTGRGQVPPNGQPAIAEARAALNAFDEAHPEVKAEIDAAATAEKSAATARFLALD